MHWIMLACSRWNCSNAMARCWPTRSRRAYTTPGIGPSKAHAPRSLKTIRSEEHTSELQSLMRISYAVFCLKKKNNKTQQTTQEHERTILHSNTNKSCQNAPPEST